MTEQFPWKATKTNEEELLDVLTELGMLQEGAWKKREVKLETVGDDWGDERYCWEFSVETKLGELTIEVCEELCGYMEHWLEIRFAWGGSLPHSGFHESKEFEKEHFKFPEVDKEFLKVFLSGAEKEIEKQVEESFSRSLEDYCRWFSVEKALEKVQLDEELWAKYSEKN